MRIPVFIATALLLAACNRTQPENASVTPNATPVESSAAQSAPQADTTIAAVPPTPGDARQEPVPPAPVVEGMYVIYACDDGTQPRITFSGNLVKIELTADSTPVILSARASATSMSDTYSDDALTLHRDGLGITLELDGGKTMRCTESEASA